MAGKFERQVPEMTVSLREVAFWATSHCLSALPARDESDEARVERARLLNNLGVRISALGRREQALAVAEEVTAIHRELARTRPDKIKALEGDHAAAGPC